MRRSLIVTLAFIAIFIADQFSKAYVFNDLLVGKSYIEITSFFKIVKTWNKGVSFSLLHQLGSHALILLTGSIIIILVVMMLRARNLFTKMSLVFIIAGASGNFMDRVRFGKVADFIYLHYQHYGWPAFNIADMAICFGVFLLLIDNFVRK